MKRALPLIALTILGLALSATVALAQTPTPPSSLATPASQSTSTPAEPIIFVWAFAEGGFAQNWLVGLMYFILGIVGALVTVYLFLGEFLPSMGGKAEYELLKLEMADYKKRRDKALTTREQFARGEVAPPQERLEAEDKLTDDYDKVIQRLERQLSGERWRLFLLGFPMYILLGGFFATAFATNLLQAILIGFGWTAVADRIGLEKESGIRKELSKAEISKVEDQARSNIAEMQARVDNLKRANEMLTLKIKGP